jgi:hypothetical protein
MNQPPPFRETADRGRVLYAELEGHSAAEHEALEVSAAPNVRRGKAVVVLVHPLTLGEQVFRHEPAAAELIAVDVHVIGHSEETAVEVDDTPAHVELILGEAIQSLVDLLRDLALRDFAGVEATRPLELAEELCAMVFDEWVDDLALNTAAEWIADLSAPRIGRFTRPGRLEDIEVRAAPRSPPYSVWLAERDCEIADIVRRRRRSSFENR